MNMKNKIQGVPRRKASGSRSTLVSSSKTRKDTRSDRSRARTRAVAAQLTTEDIHGSTPAPKSPIGVGAFIYIKHTHPHKPFRGEVKRVDMVLQSEIKPSRVICCFPGGAASIDQCRLATVKEISALGARKARPKGGVPAKRNGAKRTLKRTGGVRGQKRKRTAWPNP